MCCETTGGASAALKSLDDDRAALRMNDPKRKLGKLGWGKTVKVIKGKGLGMGIAEMKRQITISDQLHPSINEEAAKELGLSIQGDVPDVVISAFEMSLLICSEHDLDQIATVDSVLKNRPNFIRERAKALGL